MDKSIAQALINAHDGDVALLWIYLNQRESLDLEGAARQLCRTLGEMEAAYEKLQRMGLTGNSPIKAQKIEVADELPEYDTADIVRRSGGDDGFKAVTTEAQKVLGHVLSTNDLKKLFGIYDYLALPPEVIMMLLNHCVAISQGRRPSMRYIEKEAYNWANREILSLEQAEEYVSRYWERRKDMGRLQELLGLGGRELTATEKKYLSAWMEMGFDEDCFNIALDRTVTNTGALKWGYMNKILLSWQEKGIHTGKDVLEKDSRRRPQPGGKAPQNQDKPIDMDKLKNILNKM